MLKNLCPCCGKHCYLDEPRCGRGVEFQETGLIPPRKVKPDSGNSHKPSEQKLRYMAMSREEKLTWNIADMGKTVLGLSGNGQRELSGEELFECLREEEQEDLLTLLEKVKHRWRHKY